ncbi:MAG TPA: TMEM165/GDT1 family protein [Bacillota bacterium]|nr:TMEM165/GDT1 family protein [Bacillota bacterium]HOV65760.1 TMEM165/GDT1 family protein [Bacillota bacterium]HRC53123.1 TMEM165/GDT1 family protein [Bacillota bacterium]
MIDSKVHLQEEGMGLGRPARLNWETVLSTFLVVFLAELGDKTQLSTMALAASEKAVWSVFLGSALALVLSSFVGALVGASLYHIVSPHIIRLCAGGAFVVVGILMLLGKI